MEMMDDVYEGEDRIRQVIYLQNVASNIAFGSDDPSTSARDRVNYYVNNYPEELPTWFDEGDKQLLVDLVHDGDDEPESDYQGPPCPHGQREPWDCSICSAGMTGGQASWRVCRHGYTKGQCPTCDSDPRDDHGWD